MNESKSMIRIENLVQDYGRKQSALNGIDLDIKKGEFIAVIGQNGAGKTTLVKHLNGLLRPRTGRILIKGRDIKDMPTSELASTVGYVFQNPDHQLFMDRVDKEVAFGPDNLGLSPGETEKRTKNALMRVGLLDFADRFPLSLSKGQRQRVALASVLAMEPEVIILDEPTTGQDYREATQIMELVVELNNKGHTIIFITHDMQLVAGYAKRVILMGKGKILADGEPREILSHTGLLRETLLRPPQITLLAQALSAHGIAGDIVSVEELLNAVINRNREQGKSQCLVNAV